ncbi:hypothetical protein Bpfe_026384 [Biomphalaria pfeifferi]|uniref:Uncharacterized protein n=1 Tax=Biomphalaria pfeifferi TaxID=112525 RepID=A0AAD8B026_BIOPF|nr:hypothetical protein Bpfe_026384 [Biomphalaria pfeifferi]
MSILTFNYSNKMDDTKDNSKTFDCEGKKTKRRDNWSTEMGDQGRIRLGRPVSVLGRSRPCLTDHDLFRSTEEFGREDMKDERGRWVGEGGNEYE